MPVLASGAAILCCDIPGAFVFGPDVTRGVQGMANSVLLGLVFCVFSVYLVFFVRTA